MLGSPRVEVPAVAEGPGGAGSFPDDSRTFPYSYYVSFVELFQQQSSGVHRKCYRDHTGRLEGTLLFIDITK